MQVILSSILLERIQFKKDATHNCNTVANASKNRSQQHGIQVVCQKWTRLDPHPQDLQQQQWNVIQTKEV